MPKIEVYEKPFYRLIGQSFNDEKLIEILEGAKAELEEREKDEEILKIELNDTNRPDLWSTAGLARQIKSLISGHRPEYSFFSSKEKQQDNAGYTVEVDASVRDVRPFIAAFIATGKELDDPLLKDIIQSQEKLCTSFGKKRKNIAMGVYRAELIKYPIRYRAVDPEKTSFIPLGMEMELNLKSILKEHPKGIEFGYIVKDFNRYPFITDSTGDVLSFPPIINSARIGAVEVGDNHLFVELTGPDLDSLLLAASITACDMKDQGFTIRPVKIIYPFDTPYGREIVTPFYFQKDVPLKVSYACKLLGEKIEVPEVLRLLEKTGHTVKAGKDPGNEVVLTPPPFRNDFLHPVDVVEEIMIARGMASFQPVYPKDYTIGRLSDEELFSRRVREVMLGLGFQEMIFNYLGSRKDFIEKMNITDEDFIEIENPMTENYSIVRSSILPNLLASETVSANAVYPHRIFEIGKVAFKDKSGNSRNIGTKTSNYLGFLYADREAGFNDINSHISALFYYLYKEYKLEETEDPRFIPGRSGRILYNGKEAGMMGEIHPDVLANWGIQIPCACVEINLDEII
jgi:phenylalanyl-tRNA synthetase beta chain